MPDVSCALKQRHFLLAGHAPGCPEVEKHRLTPILAQANRCAVDRLRGEAWGQRADARPATLDRDVDAGGPAQELHAEENDHRGRQEERAEDFDAERPGKPGVGTGLNGGVQCDKTAPAAASAKMAARYTSEKWKRREAQRRPSAVRPRHAIQRTVPPRSSAPTR